MTYVHSRPYTKQENWNPFAQGNLGAGNACGGSGCGQETGRTRWWSVVIFGGGFLLFAMTHAQKDGQINR